MNIKKHLDEMKSSLANYKKMTEELDANDMCEKYKTGLLKGLKLWEYSVKDLERAIEYEENNPVHVYDTTINRGRITVHISHKTGYGYWERDGEAIGGLWFTDGLLSDYDGCYQLPKTVVQILATNFYIPKDELENY